MAKISHTYECGHTKEFTLDLRLPRDKQKYNNLKKGKANFNWCSDCIKEAEQGALNSLTDDECREILQSLLDNPLTKAKSEILKKAGYDLNEI